MSLSGDKGVAQFKKSVKMEHPIDEADIFEDAENRLTTNIHRHDGDGDR